MSGERKTCLCGRVPINADGLCATCDDGRHSYADDMREEEISAAEDRAWAAAKAAKRAEKSA